MGHDSVAAGDPLNGLVAEAWLMHESLAGAWEMHVMALGLRRTATANLLGRPIRLRTRLADGGLGWRSGVVRGAQGRPLAGGALVRYRLTVAPFTWPLTRRRASQVWQDRTLPEILDDLLAPTRASGAWRYAAEVPSFLQDGNHGGTYPYRVQYRESDWDAVLRELAREGLSHVFVEDEAAPALHRLDILADTTRLPEDPTSAARGGVEVQRSSSQREGDALLFLGRGTVLQSAMTTVVGWDHVNRRIVAASSPALAPKPLQIEEFDDAGTQAFSSAAAAEHYADLRRGAADCREHLCFGYSTLRTARVGTTLRVRGDHDLLSRRIDPRDPPRLLLTRLDHAGLNTLPEDVVRALTGNRESSGPELLDELARDWPHGPLPARVLAQARASGYANAFEAADGKLPWYPRPPARRPRLDLRSPALELELPCLVRVDVGLAIEATKERERETCALLRWESEDVSEYVSRSHTPIVADTGVGPDESSTGQGLPRARTP